MGEYKYEAGNVLDFPLDQPTLIVHGCNNQGRWGAGFTGNLSKWSMEPELAYRRAMRTHKADLGRVIVSRVGIHVVAHCITQEGTLLDNEEGYVPFRLTALKEALVRLRRWLSIQDTEYVIRMPKIGAGLAKGDWTLIEPVIKAELCNYGYSVTVKYFQ